MVHVPSMFQLCLSRARDLRFHARQIHPVCTRFTAIVLVPRAGLEPARLSAGDFESPASTYFATWAGVLLCWSVWSDLNRQSLASEASGLTKFSHTQKGWSEYKDSNLGPSAPKADALPDCATLRNTMVREVGLEPTEP